MMPFPPHLTGTLRQHWPAIAITAAGAAVFTGVYLSLRRKLSPEEREVLRRDRLAAGGRIIDGTLLDATPSEGHPSLLLYRYRVAGVTYDCVQDVSTLSHRIGTVRLELPIQVRYDPHNPGDSIAIADTWNGLWSASPQAH